MIDARYLLSLPNIPKTFLLNKKSNNKYKSFQKDGCFKSSLYFQENTLKEIESSAYKRLFKVKSIKDFRIHKTIKLERISSNASLLKDLSFKSLPVLEL